MTVKYRSLLPSFGNHVHIGSGLAFVPPGHRASVCTGSIDLERFDAQNDDCPTPFEGRTKEIFRIYSHACGLHSTRSASPAL